MATFAQTIAGMTPAQRAAFVAYMRAVAPVGEPIPPPGLSPMERAQFDMQRQNLGAAYQEGLAGLDFERGNFLRQNRWEGDDARRAYIAQREALPQDFAARGLLTSGLKNRALTDLNSDRQRWVSRFMAQRQGTLGGFGLRRQQLGSQRWRGLSQLGALRAARKQQLGTQIGAQ